MVFGVLHIVSKRFLLSVQCMAAASMRSASRMDVWQGVYEVSNGGVCQVWLLLQGGPVSVWGVGPGGQTMCFSRGRE